MSLLLLSFGHSLSPLLPLVCQAMAAQKRGRGNKTASSMVGQWVAQGCGAGDITKLLKEAGYKKARISQLLKEVKAKVQALT